VSSQSAQLRGKVSRWSWSYQAKGRLGNDEARAFPAACHCDDILTIIGNPSWICRVKRALPCFSAPQELNFCYFPRFHVRDFRQVLPGQTQVSDNPSEQPADVKFEIGQVLFIDIVGYSKLLITEQSDQLQTLKAIVRGTEHRANNRYTILPAVFQRFTFPRIVPEASNSTASFEAMKPSFFSELKRRNIS
jgi:hypothetical protein